MNRVMLLTFFPLLLLFFDSCNPARKWEKEEEQQIEDYLRTLGDTAVVIKPSGLYYIELIEGTGPMPVVNDTVCIRYKSTLLTGQLFDSNYKASDPFEFIVGSGVVVTGVDEGVRYMKEGGKSRLITPSGLAFGPGGIWGILSGYTPLLWNIELVSVRPGAK